MNAPYKVEKLAIGADHLGYELKAAIAEHLRAGGIEVCDIGTDSTEPVDYPDIGAQLAHRLADGEFERGILVCGTGAGMAIAANKVRGVRAVCAADPYTAERAIASNDAQVLTLGALVTGTQVAKMLVDIYLANEFQGGRSAPKVAKLQELDEG